MFKAIGQFFTALFTMFSALEKGAASLPYQGRSDDILDQRAIIKSRTMMRKKVQNLRLAG
ncbi:MAG: hypothetical protein VB996_12460 [Pseudomonadales bacterium]